MINKAQYYIIDKPSVLGAMAVFPYTDALYGKFWAEDKYTKEQFNFSRKFGGALYVPRELALNRHYAKDIRSNGPNVSYGPATQDFAWRNDDQQRVYDESLALLQKDKSHIVKCPTGTGKTVIACRLMRALGLKTLVIVNKGDQLNEKQWLGAIKKFAGVPASKIGLIRQDKCDVKGKTVVLAMVHSLSKEGKYPKWVYEEFGLCIVDEVHHMAAETFQVAIQQVNSKLRLGLSAGASSKKDQMRSDGKDFVFEAHIGEVAVQLQSTALSPKILVVETPYKLPIVTRRIKGEWKKVPLPHEPGKIGHVLVDMAKHALRNKLILELTVKAYKKGRRVVVFSDLARDKHLDLLRTGAIAMGIPSKDIGFYVGGMKEVALEDAKQKRVVFATYKMCEEAVDVPWWDTCILGTPKANVKQAIGRILREQKSASDYPHAGAPAKQKPIVFDLVDTDSGVCIGYFRSRTTLYQSKEINAEVLQVSA